MFGWSGGWFGWGGLVDVVDWLLIGLLIGLVSVD